jgi:hypothetical protein
VVSSPREPVSWGFFWTITDYWNSNQIDLRILKEMGVDIPKREKYEKKLTPKQKFRAGVFTVIAAMRISDLQEDWASWKAVGEELKAKASGGGSRSARQAGANEQVKRVASVGVRAGGR